MQNNYSCCFICLNDNLLNEKIKENTKNIIEDLIFKCNVKNFYFSNLNKFEKFVYEIVSSKKCSEPNIRRIKCRNPFEEVILNNKIYNNLTLIKKRNIDTKIYDLYRTIHTSKSNLCSYYKNLINLSDFSVFVNEKSEIALLYNNLLGELFSYAKCKHKFLLFV